MTNGNYIPMLRKADAREIQTIYEWMTRQFHAGELKPLKLLQDLYTQQRYAAYVLCDGDEMLAYAMFGLSPDAQTWLLDYYAVLPQYQDRGLGGAFLKLLREELQQMNVLLEVEIPEFAPDAEEEEVCRRRIAFYDRNGCAHTSVSLNLYGYEYAILRLSPGGSDASARAALEEIYHMFFPVDAYREHVRFHQP